MLLSFLSSPNRSDGAQTNPSQNAGPPPKADPAPDAASETENKATPPEDASSAPVSETKEPSSNVNESNKVTASEKSQPSSEETLTPPNRYDSMEIEEQFRAFAENADTQINSDFSTIETLFGEPTDLFTLDLADSDKGEKDIIASIYDARRVDTEISRSVEKTL
ncbi:hypothetical protein [Litorimonas haliclonae]|uniref:hypothetical protein n=1 Tax=Litorimonas haliclonae TaxID=2081977 RepID=UPI0039EE2DCC